MAGTTVDRTIAGQESAIDSKVAEITIPKNAVEEGMKVQNAVIGELSTTIVEIIKLQTAKIDKLATTVAESVKLQNDRIDTHIAKMDAHIAGMDARIAKVDARIAKVDAQTTQVEAFIRLFSNQQDAIKSLERRIEANHREVVAPMFKFVWAIIGSGLFAVFALFGRWLMNAFGLV